MQYGANVKTYCMDVYHFTNEELIVYLSNNNFDMVLLGFMAPRFRRTVKELCSTVANNIDKSTWFVLGGYGPSATPRYVLEQTKADVVCMGEAEETIVELASKRINNNIDFSDIEGVAYFHEGIFKETARRARNKNLDSIPFPAWDIFPMEIYTTNLKFSPMSKKDKCMLILSTRGCTDKCSFCYRLEQGVRMRSPKNIVSEMKLLHERYGVTFFDFADELSVVSKKQILKLTKKIKEELPDVSYQMECRVTCFDDEIAFALKDSGCKFLNIGFESSSQIVLDQMNKRATVEQNIDAAERCKRVGIGVGINVIWGMPGDNEETLRKNAEFIKKYNQYDQVRTIRPVTPYPGSPLYYQAIAQNKLTGVDDFFNKFENADGCMINFMGLDEDYIYKILLEVNTDLIYDHYKHTNNDFNEAEKLIADLKRIYQDPSYVFTGTRKLSSNKHLRSDFS